MQPLPKEGTRYAFLLVLLFAIAALATKAIIDYIGPLVGIRELRTITIVVCALTMGLMLISGAYGLWAIRFSTEAESLRRLGSLVDAMDYIRDGVLAIDRQGHITGRNPAAREFFGDELNSLSEICSGLTASDIDLLLKSTHPEEVESICRNGSEQHTLRFRSQPSKGVTLILVSDVTKLADNRMRHHRAAYLQLVGHIAQGVANDFNSLLCGISGHASLITRALTEPMTVQKSADAISDCANRGVQLAGRLLELSQPPHSERLGTAHPATGVDAAIDGLAADLPSRWSIDRKVATDIPPTNLTVTQLEHIIQSLGLQATETYGKEGVLTIQLSAPSEAGLCQTPQPSAGVVIVAPTDIASVPPDELHLRKPGSIRLLESVVASMLEQVDGTLECFTAPGGIPVYRVSLPHASADDIAEQSEDLPLGLEAYVAGWHVLVCKKEGPPARSQLEHVLRECQVTAESTSSVVDALARIESGTDLGAIIIHGEILGPEPEGLLRAITKLCPQAGLVVLDDQENDTHPLASDVVFVPAKAHPVQAVRAMIEARSLARARQRQA